ncbi:uncharacterized protein LOC141679120 [Apium graveolens]|uniref:uncharacterized protein LOC141679120 n=1 Tax=Apium graveolens TaxID=4045 RepID=UPI003D7BEEDE
MENHHPEHEQLYFHNGEYQVQGEHESGIPPGYRFVPDDIQLIDDYLKVIVDNPELGGVNDLIFTVNLYGSSPDELTAAHQEQCENTWYFFTKRIRKYPNGIRPDRAAGDGYWKQTNVVSPIFRAGENNKEVKIGRKITLDYLCKRDGSEKDGARTDWKMTEYRLDGVNLLKNHSSSEFDEWCLCRLYKSKNAKKTEEDDPQENLAMEVEPNAVAELIVPQEPNAGALLIVAQEHNGHVAGEQHNNFVGQSTAAPFGGQNIGAQEHNGHVAGALRNNFAGQSTAAPFGGQNIVAQQQYNGQNAGGPGNNAVWNPNNSNYMENGTTSSMNGFHYCTDALNDHQDMFPQPLRSLPPNGFPTSSNYNTSQSSSDIPDYDATNEWDFDYPSSLFPGNGQSSFDIDFTFDDFDL